MDKKGFSGLSVQFTKALPAITTYNIRLELSDAEAKKAKELQNHYEKLKDDYKALFKETETALINLRTFKNVEKELPEATPYLPAMGLTVIVDTTELRKKLK
jgi:hypothetical protein